MILSALHHGAKLRTEELHLKELGIATLSAMFVNANRDPKKGEAAKPSDFWYFKPEQERDRISSDAVNAFFSLITDEKMPSWVVAIAPIEKLRSSKTDDPAPKCRAWMKKGVLLLAPKIDGDSVRVGLAFVDGVVGRVAVIDPDSGVAREVFVPNQSEESFWQQDMELRLGKD